MAVNFQDKLAKGEKLTTKETEEVLDLVDEVANSIAKAAADKKLNWLDLPKLLPVMNKINPAMKDINKVWPEIKDLDPREADHLMSRFSVTIMAWSAAIAALSELKA